MTRGYYTDIERKKVIERRKILFPLSQETQPDVSSFHSNITFTCCCKLCIDTRAFDIHACYNVRNVCSLTHIFLNGLFTMGEWNKSSAENESVEIRILLRRLELQRNCNAIHPVFFIRDVSSRGQEIYFLFWRIFKSNIDKRNSYCFPQAGCAFEHVKFMKIWFSKDKFENKSFERININSENCWKSNLQIFRVINCPNRLFRVTATINFYNKIYFCFLKYSNHHYFSFLFIRVKRIHKYSA